MATLSVISSKLHIFILQEGHTDTVNFSSLYLLSFIKQFSISCHSDVQGVGEGSHVPGQLAGFPDEWLDDRVGGLGWQVKLRVAIQSSGHILLQSHIKIYFL